MDFVKVFGVCIVSLCLGGCASLPTSSKGLYGESPDALATGSANQERRVLLSNFDIDDTKHAVRKALGLEGIAPEVVKSKMLSGVAEWTPNPYDYCHCGFAAYFRSSGPGTTEVILVADEFGGLLRTRGAGKRFITQLVKSINTVLASYE